MSNSFRDFYSVEISGMGSTRELNGSGKNTINSTLKINKYFDEVPFVDSFLYVPCFRGHVCEDVAAWNV